MCPSGPRATAWWGHMTYRLAPQSTWPSGPQDMAAAVSWVRANIASYGGDPSRVFLMGSSAGANHVASYVAFPEFHAAPGSGLAGAILLSGSPFDLTVFDMEPYKPYFGEDASKYAQISPTPGLLKTSVPLMVVWAGLDPPGIGTGIHQPRSRALQNSALPNQSLPRDTQPPFREQRHRHQRHRTDRSVACIHESQQADKLTAALFNAHFTRCGYACAPRTRRCDNRIETLFVAAREAAIGTSRH